MKIESTKYQSEFDAIKAENLRLKKENLELIKQIQILEEDKAVSETLRAESFVARLVRGVLSEHNASFDIEINQGRIKLEVKFSRLNIAARHTGAPTKHLAWAKPLGESGNKEFDRLILLGLKDERYMKYYLDPLNKFIIFDVPYNDIIPLTISTNAGRYRSIQLTTNPSRAKSSASPLFEKYQITSDELERRYSNIKS